MAKRLLPPDWHVTKDNGDPATDATLTFKLAGTSTDTPIWYDKDLTLPTTAGVASVNCDATGYPAAAGSDIAIWGRDDVTYDVVVAATGYNGSASKTIEDIAVADATTTDETSSELALGNAIPNGGLEACSGATSGSNLSGDGDGDETVDGWFLTQPAAASNEWSQQDGFAVGANPVEARKSVRVGRPSSSTSTNEIRWWATLKPSEVYRLRGKEVTLRFSVKAGANFSASGAALAIRLATGTTESEDGDLIDAGGFAGQANPLDQSQAISTTAQRFEYTFELGETIKEIGLQFSYTGVGTAGAADYFQIQDIELKEATASEEFSALPEVIEFLRTKLSTLGRKFVAFPLADPDADRITFWDDSEGAFGNLSLGTGLAITTTTLSLASALTDLIAVPLSQTVLGYLDDVSGAFGTAAYVADNTLVHLAGAETIAGAKTFSDNITFNTSLKGCVFSGGGQIADQSTTRTYIAANGDKLDILTEGLAAFMASITASGITIGASAVHVRQAGKNGVPVPASAMIANTTNGAASGITESTTNKVMLRTLDFDQTTQEGAQFLFPMPKSWNESTVTFQPIWTAASGSGGVVWELRGVALSDDDAFDAAFGTGQTSTDTLIATGDVHIGPESSAITIAGTPAEGDLVVFQIRRNVSDGSDTLTGDAKLIGVRLNITTNAANDA